MSRISVDELSEELRRAISGLKDEKGLDRAGIVTRVGDGIVWIYGLREAGYNEILKIETVDGKTIESFALNLMEDEIGAVLLGDESRISAGAKAQLTGKTLTVPVAQNYWGA